MQDVANPLVVKKVHERLAKISTDGIVGGGYIEQYISDNPLSLFPLTQSTERPDKLTAALLEGRVVILIDGSSDAIIVPVTVNELYQSSEDYYFSFGFGVFLRIFRIIGNMIAVLLPGIYVALFAVNAGSLPIRLALTVSGGRIGVAFPLVFNLSAQYQTAKAAYPGIIGGNYFLVEFLFRNSWSNRGIRRRVNTKVQLV